jgi:hypothetical protein
MSDYFDGLMRSSGLPLGQAPVLGPSPRDAAPLTEIDVEVPAAAPLIGPLDVTAQAVQHAFAALPVPRGSALAPQPVSSKTAPVMAPAPASAELPPQVDEVKPSPAAAPPASALAPLAAFPAVEPTMSRERITQAAMRWVAAGPAQAPTDPVPADTTPATSAEMRPVEPPASIATATPSDPPRPPESVPTIARRIESPPPPAVPEARLPSRAVVVPTPQATPPTHEDALHVSIGAIHLRVEAPLPPALQAAPARRLPASVPVTPRSGLSRRALRRI